MVIANLMISPSEAYVLKYAAVKYKVEQIRQNSVVGKRTFLTYYSGRSFSGLILNQGFSEFWSRDYKTFFHTQLS